MDHALIVLCALLLNGLFAGPAPLYAAVGMGALCYYPVTLIRQAERKLNRDHRSAKERETRGFLLAVAVIFGSMTLGWLCRVMLHQPLPFIELVMVAIALPVRPTWDTASSVQRGLRAGDTIPAHAALEDTAWRHHALLDEHGLARAGIELLAVHFSEKILAPIFWYLLFGLPGLFASKAAYLLQETLTRPGASEKEFSRPAHQAHYLLHYVPARIAAGLWLAGSLFLPGMKLRETAQKIAPVMSKGSPQAVSLMAAASVLNLSLGGPTSIYADGQWVGSGTAKPGAAELRRALYLFAFMCVLLFILIGVFL